MSSYDHCEWLRVLSTGSETILSVMFSGCQNRGANNGTRNKRLALFHRGESTLFPRSLVFEYGNYQTGVKVRWPEGSLDRVCFELQHRICAAWHGWHSSLSSLVVHVDGRSAN